MSSFQVTPEALQGLAGAISGLIGEIVQASSRVEAGAPGCAQNGRLEGAINGFLGDWTSNLSEMKDKLDAVSSKLTGSASAYESAEQHIVDGFHT